jgi:hypothetical protein
VNQRDFRQGHCQQIEVVFAVQRPIPRLNNTVNQPIDIGGNLDKLTRPAANHDAPPGVRIRQHLLNIAAGAGYLRPEQAEPPEEYRGGTDSDQHGETEHARNPRAFEPGHLGVHASTPTHNR